MKLPLSVLALAFATSAMAEDRPFCAERPGQVTPPCIIEPRRVMVEVGVADWSRTHDQSSRTDLVTVGDVFVRTGITDRAEIQLGWTAFGRQTVLDRTTGQRARSSGIGDVTIAVKQALGEAKGPAAIRVFATLPTGTGPLQSEDWSAGAMAPLAFDLSKTVELDLTPEVDASANQDGHGRHLTIGGVAGLGFALSDRAHLGVDVAAFRDEEPTAASTIITGSTSLAYMVAANTQLDVGTIVGFKNGPDVELYFGIARRF